MPAGTRKRRGRIAAAILVGTLAGAIPAADAGIDATSFSQTFASTGAEQVLTIPDGIEEIHVIAIGGAGSNAGGSLGGQGSRLETDLAVSPGTLFVEVGSTATGPAGGFNGGGDAGTGTNSGGGGGGASDIRMIARADPGTLGSRLLMAAGGGGAGASGSGGFMGGAGGTADVSMSSGLDGGGFVAPHFAGGGGGGGALFDDAGNPGAAGAPDAGPSGTAGGVGTLGTGGEGGDGVSNGGAGGGGGGGVLGGGGGGGGGLDTHEAALPGGGGGGGGGASFAIDGGAVTEVAPGTEPSIAITYTAPGTAIDGPNGRVESRKARKRVVFELTSSIAEQSFECSLDGNGFAPCETPFSRKLRAGRHKLLVAAVDPGTGNADPTPAKGKFRIVHKP